MSAMYILITGASGLVATELISLLSKETDYNLILMTRNREVLNNQLRFFDNLKAEILEVNELESLRGRDIDCVVHTAFARSADGRLLADSLDFTSALNRICQIIGVRKFINISSQSVYGGNYDAGISENGVCNPSDLYAMAKYGAELICQDRIYSDQMEVYNIRLASVCENARFMKVFVHNVISGKPVCVTAPNQVVSFIDVRDVAVALKRVIDTDEKGGVYNLGSGEWYTILDVAERVKSIANTRYGFSDVLIDSHDDGRNTRVGMSISKFKETFNWTPEYSLDLMIISLFDMLLNVKMRGGVFQPV